MCVCVCHTTRPQEWPFNDKKIQNKAYCLFVINLITHTKEYYRNGRSLKICRTMHYPEMSFRTRDTCFPCRLFSITIFMSPPVLYQQGEWTGAAAGPGVRGGPGGWLQGIRGKLPPNNHHCQWFFKSYLGPNFGTISKGICILYSLNLY